MSSKFDFNSFLFSFYLIQFNLYLGLDFELKKIVTYASLILILTVSIFISVIKKNVKINLVLFYIFTLVSIFVFLSSLNTKNTFAWLYYQDFILQGAITIYLFSKCKNYDNILRYLSIITSVVFLLYFLDPFFGYQYTRNYLDYGMKIILPAFMFSSIQRKFYKKLFYIIIEISSFVLLVFFSNRNALLVSLVAYIILDLLITKPSNRKLFKYLIFSSLVFSISFFTKEIVLFLINNSVGIYSYSLNAILQMLEGTSTGLSSRDIIWSNAFRLLNNNPLFGVGIGYFHMLNGEFVHNIFLEILVSFGYFFGIAIILYILLSVFKIIKNNKNPLLISIVIMGMFPLMFNDYFMTWSYFWIMLFIGSNEIFFHKITS